MLSQHAVSGSCSKEPIVALKELKQIDDLSGMVLIEVGDQGVDLVGASELGTISTIVVFFDAAGARQRSHESERARLVSGCWLELDLRAVAGRIVGDRRIGRKLRRPGACEQEAEQTPRTRPK
ncbi:hypothetical protein NLM33_26690 [Bradyrhizobium sp. CCGUVB1N3]|uniref:hypothetical protein n=1 Tax=Bradyrhizobium sp. CCGUVB1N3 TaxID=2949629 RepID=UPI0020B31715|nr:hypothetical protein [Bradyrhizobium sp. CCGUVB1N3]MCP3473909.1 hypothetical protein [Bradyrhizobium sp. CCGUVB1N3]